MKSNEVEQGSAWVAEFREAFQAVATGLWARRGNELFQVAVAFSPALPAEVASDFAAATARVPLDRLDLGIVQAVVTSEVAVARREVGPSGSRGWLARFGARGSWAVPLHRNAEVCGVFAVALPDEPADPADIERRLQLAADRALAALS